MARWKVATGVVFVLGAGAGLGHFSGRLPRATAPAAASSSDWSRTRPTAAVAQLSARIAELERSGHGDVAGLRALTTELSRLEQRLARVEAAPSAEPPPPPHTASRSGPERLRDMQTEFEAEHLDQSDSVAATTLRARTSNLAKEHTELSALSFDSVDCTPKWCFTTASLQDGTDFQALFPTVLSALSDFATEISFAVDPESHRVALSLARPGHRLPWSERSAH